MAVSSAGAAAGAGQGRAAAEDEAPAPLAAQRCAGGPCIRLLPRCRRAPKGHVLHPTQRSAACAVFLRAVDSLELSAKGRTPRGRLLVFCPSHGRDWTTRTRGTRGAAHTWRLHPHTTRVHGRRRRRHAHAADSVGQRFGEAGRRWQGPPHLLTRTHACLSTARLIIMRLLVAAHQEEDAVEAASPRSELGGDTRIPRANGQVAWASGHGFQGRFPQVFCFRGSGFSCGKGVDGCARALVTASLAKPRSEVRCSASPPPLTPLLRLRFCVCRAPRWRVPRRTASCPASEQRVCVSDGAGCPHDGDERAVVGCCCHRSSRALG